MLVYIVRFVVDAINSILLESVFCSCPDSRAAQPRPGNEDGSSGSSLMGDKLSNIWLAFVFSD